MTETNVDVLIAGAGPTGLTLAIELARRGISFQLIEKQPVVSGSRGKGLQPRTLEVFDDLGIIDDIRASAELYPPIRIYAGRLPIWTVRMHKHRDATSEVPYPMTLMLPQSQTEQALRNRLAELGGSVQSGTELVDFRQDSDFVTATLRCEGALRTVRARYLVGADGGRSVVRKTLGIGFEGETRDGERMLIGDVRVEGLDRSKWHIWVNLRKRQPRVAMCPMPGSDIFQLTAPLAPGAEPAFDLAAYQRIFAEGSGRRDVRLTSLEWASIYRVNIRMVTSFQLGRVFLAGDAAHVHSPAGGQGLNTGVQDAYNLGWKLARVLNGGSPSLLETYDAERRAVAGSMLGLSTRLHDQASKGGSKAYKRDEETSQLLLNYRDSPLSDGAALATGLQPGDRAPDAAGNGLRLFDMLRHPGFTLLALSPVTDVPGVKVCRVGEDFLDSGGHLAAAYGTTGYVLIRPDGYLALTATTVTQIEDYLARV